MAKYIKSISEIVTCVGIYHSYTYFEKSLRRNDLFLPLESWNESVVLKSLQEDSNHANYTILSAGLAYALCRGVGPMISTVITNIGVRNFDVLLAKSSFGTVKLPRQSIILYSTIAIGAFFLEPTMIKTLEGRESPEKKRESALNYFQSFNVKSINVLFDAFLFHSYLFRRLYFLAGPIVAHYGTAVAFALSHAARDLNDGGVSSTSFLKDLFISMCCQVGYHSTGRLSLAIICNSLGLFQESLIGLEYSLIEASSFWRQIVASINMKFKVGSITLPPDHQLLLLNKFSSNSPSLSTEDLQTARDFIDRYTNYYNPIWLNTQELHEEHSLNWEDVTDVLTHFRSILALVLYKQKQKRNPANMTKQDSEIEIMDFKSNQLVDIISTDSIGSWAYSTWRDQRISRDDLKDLLLNEFARVGITSEQLKSFEESFNEINSILSSESSPHKEVLLLELIDVYYRSVIQSLLKTSSGIIPTERISSLPLFPDAILEGLSVTPPAPTVVRNPQSSLSRRDYEDLCFASRRGALRVLHQYGLTIRMWNKLLDYNSTKYPSIQVKREKWIQYLNGEDFEQLVRTHQRGQRVDSPFGQEMFNDNTADWTKE